MDFNNEEKKDISFEPFDFALKENLDNFLPGDNQFMFPVNINENITVSFLKPLPMLDNFFAPSLENMSNLDVNIIDNKVSNEKSDVIFESIQKNNPALLKNLEFYGVPDNIAKLIVKELINLTLSHR